MMYSLCTYCFLRSQNILSTSRLMRQMSTKIKLMGNVDGNILEAVDAGLYKPKHHPGRLIPGVIEIPKPLMNAISIVLNGHPITKLVGEGESLDRYLKARHPPVSAGEQKTKKYNWEPIDYDDPNCKKYLVGRMPADYAALIAVFTELKKRLPEFRPATIFDFGSGVGSVSWAALSIWKECIEELYCVDSSGSMNNLAELLLRGGDINANLPIKGTYFRQFLPASNARTYDLVVSAFTLFELPSTEARLNTLHNLWSKTEKCLVLLEQGSRAGFELINEAREFILYLSKREKISSYTFAPCPHDFPCPRYVDQDDHTPCNFEIRYLPVKNFNKFGNMRKERFCYVILNKGPRPTSLTPWPKIVRQPLVRTRHTICRLCTSEGKLEEITFTMARNGKNSYHLARSSNWGDLLPIEIVERKKKVFNGKEPQEGTEPESESP